MSTRVDVSLPLVLVAHHARDTVELLKALLEREGFTTLCAYHGRSALQYAHQHHPSLLLLDQAACYSITLKDGREVPVTAHYSSLGEPGTPGGYTMLALEPNLAGAQLP